jgi:hypothetical protein
MFGDAFRTIQSVLLLQSKVEHLDDELAATGDQLNRVIGTVVAIDRRVVRLETLEEVRGGNPPPPRLEQ